MDKIYGYKEKDVLGLAEFLKTRGGESLSKVFESYGEKFGKAKGTVRNLYYAVAKRSAEDSDFCERYLDGKPLSVGKIIEFDEQEESALIKKVLIAKTFGRSARSCIMELAEGDAKVALRYQNKFRNAVKQKPQLIKTITEQLEMEGYDISKLSAKCEKQVISEENFERLKEEINAMVAKIAMRERKENQELKERVSALEKENLRLCTALYGDPKGINAIKFFKVGGEENMLN
ncbi:MAG: hypothetical protein E7340_06235 [Clostridiales bacterium]|nr:hypothetical protein [Clostridiales bacterium]